MIASRARRVLAAVDDLFGRWRAPLSMLTVLGMLLWLLLRLDAIGWVAVWAARPRAFGFYALAVAGYFVLPVADAFIYRRLWRIRFLPTLGVFLRKRIYNSVVAGYSGEVWLLLWARSHIARPEAALAHDIKDSNVLSAAVSSCGAAILAVWLIHRFAFGTLVADGIGWWGLVTVCLAAAVPVGLLFRRRILAAHDRDAAVILAIHAVRFGAGLLLAVGAWHVALEHTPWSALASLLALQVLVNRIPFVPNGDLLFASVALALSGPLAFAQATLAGVLLTTSALNQILHLTVFAVVALLPGSRP